MGLATAAGGRGIGSVSWGAGVQREWEWVGSCHGVGVAGFAMDMLNNMAGKRGDTPLMNAAANGTQFMAGTGRGRVGG